MFPQELETGRLRLERLSHETVDVTAYYDLWATADAAVFEYLSATPYATLGEAKDEIDDAEEWWAADETATYLVRPQASESNAYELAGRTSLDCEWDDRRGEIGVMLDSPFWGRGYASECADALLELAFERLDLRVVTAEHRDGHERSRRAVEKAVVAAGGRHEGTDRRAGVDGAVETHHRYSITRAEYRAGTD